MASIKRIASAGAQAQGFVLHLVPKGQQIYKPLGLECALTRLLLAT